MKLTILICCIGIGIAQAAPTVEKTPTEPGQEVPVLQGKNAIDQGSKPDSDASSAMIKVGVDNANKLLYDLDATVNKLFSDDKIVPVKEEKSDDSDGTIEDAQVYSAANRELDFYPRQTEAAHGQGASLVTQLENLEKRLLNTINELQTRRRFFSSSMLRQMYNSVHRIRVNISRIQTQFSSPQQPASAQPSPPRPGQAPGIMNNLQQRVSDIQKAVNEIINRVTSTFQGPNAQKPHTGQAVPTAF